MTSTHRQIVESNISCLVGSCPRWTFPELSHFSPGTSYGDERALPLLRQAIEDFEPIWDSEFGMLELREFLDTYEHIAGTVPDDLLKHSSKLQDAWETQLAETLSAKQPAVSNKIGRNEPCPCGSGKKHKKCCQA